MTRTARRRWSRELESLVDGIALGGQGPVLVHGYDPPAGGKWLDDVIPGKLLAFDRGTGESLWTSPCEVGYGRGFGAGLGGERDVVVLGPSLQGHRIVRQSLETGELLGAASLDSFDEAIVAGDVCVSVTPNKILAVMTSEMTEIWSHSDPKLRFHQVARDGDRLFVVNSERKTKRYGVSILGLETGKRKGQLIDNSQRGVHAVVAGAGVVVCVVSDILDALPPGGLSMMGADNMGDDFGSTLTLIAFPAGGSPGEPPHWMAPLPIPADDDYPDLHICIDSGKLYIVREAHLSVRDALSGRLLGDLTVPGLDERVSWSVSQGAGLLAEEQRVSIFEIPV